MVDLNQREAAFGRTLSIPALGSQLWASGDVRIDVDCHAGYQGEETPWRLRLDDRTVEVTDVIDRWFAADHRYFKVKGEDGATYILRHDAKSGAWELVMFDSGRAIVGRADGAAGFIPDRGAKPGSRRH